MSKRKKNLCFLCKRAKKLYSKECRGWKRKSCSPEGLGWTWNMLWWGWWRGKICLWVCFYQQYWSENNAAPVPDLWRHWLSWKLGGDTWQTNSTIQADRRRIRWWCCCWRSWGRSSCTWGRWCWCLPTSRKWKLCNCPEKLFIAQKDLRTFNDLPPKRVVLFMSSWKAEDIVVGRRVGADWLIFWCQYPYFLRKKWKLSRWFEIWWLMLTQCWQGDTLYYCMTHSPTIFIEGICWVIKMIDI